MTSLLCVHCLPANLGLSEPEIGLEHMFVLFFGKRRMTNGWNGKICTIPNLQKQLQTAL
jgi:hypothetical protein